MQKAAANEASYNRYHYKRTSGATTATKANKENGDNGPPAAKRAATDAAVDKHHKGKKELSSSKVYTIAQVGQVSEEDLLGRFGYVAEQVVGSGKYCRVRCVTDMRMPFTLDQQGNSVPLKFALKIIDTSVISHEFFHKFLPREVDVWQQLKHPNLVQMLGKFNYGSVFFICMEYVCGGDLLSYVQESGPVGEADGKHWMWQLLHATHYMHKNSIAHRDLKLENILIDQRKQLKIGDFGFCRKMAATYELSQTYCGSKAYSCPEILAGVPYDVYKADVWALGVIGFIMATNKMPFNEHVKHNKLIIQSQRERKYTYERSLALSTDYQNTLDAMMTFSQSERPTCAQVMQAPVWQSVLVQAEHSYALPPY